MNKPTILMFPSWFPTKDNPYNGVFFKEQMVALSERYNFIVFRTFTRKVPSFLYLIKKIQGKSIFLIREEGDCCEQYTCYVLNPLYLYLTQIINFLKVKLNRIKLPDGCGEYVSEKNLLKLSSRFAKLFSKYNIKADLVYGLTAQDMAVYTYCAAKALRKPYVLGEHAPFPWPGHVLNNLQKILIEEANAHLVISKDKVRQILLQNIKIKNWNYVGNLVDETMFPFEPVEHEKVTFVIVAANSFYKNYDMFIKTMDILSEICEKDFSVVVAGFGANKGYSKNAEELIKKINVSKFADKVELIPAVPRSEMAMLYNRCDAFVMTSIQEGQPVSTMEAGCCGLPIFSTRCGGVEDYVSEDIGRIVDITDCEKLAGYLNDFLNKKIVFDKLAIRNKLISLFGKDAFVKNVSSVFDNLIC